MNLKKMWKRFWTMNVHNHEGFTLVELIIVIAILAILSSVAVVGYSSYVEKANKQADETLVSEIKNALMLAYYSGEINENGYVVLTMDAATPSDEDVTNALNAAFGSLNGLKLKYNGWKEGGYSGSYSASVNGSFVTGMGTDALLEEVYGCTTELAEFIIGLGWEGQQGAASLDQLLENKVASSMLSGYDNIGGTELANATVFGIANTLNDNAEAAEVVEKFANTEWITIPLSTSDINLDEVAHKYAALEALANYFNCTEYLNDFNANGMTSEDPATIISALNDACTNTFYAVGAKDEAALMAYYAVDAEGKYGENSRARQDGEAYVSTMQAVDKLSSDYTSSLSNANLFTAGTVGKELDTYLALMGAIPNDGAYYAIRFTIDSTGIRFND